MGEGELLFGLAGDWIIGQVYGAEPGFVRPVPHPSFYKTDSIPPINPYLPIAGAAIPAGLNSYEVYFFLPFQEDAVVSDIRIFLSEGLPTGVSVKYKSNWTGGTSKYTRPIATASAIAVTDLALEVPASANVTVGNSLTFTKQRDAAFKSDLIVMQVQTTSSAATGLVYIPIVVNYKKDGVDTYRSIPMYAYISADGATSVPYSVEGTFMDYTDVTGMVEEPKDVAGTFWDYIDVEGRYPEGA
jgi:hypothetical protein